MRGLDPSGLLLFSQKQVDWACNDGIPHIKLNIDASAVNGNKLMSHLRFYGGLLLTSVARGCARLLNYLLCPLSSLHWLCFLTMGIKKKEFMGMQSVICTERKTAKMKR